MLTSQFRSKTILMTAATSGIGKAAARMYGEAGAQTVILNGRNAETGAKVSAELAALNPGTQYRFIQGDIGVAAQIGRLFSEMRDIAPRLDVFVHCGGAQIAPTFFKHLDPSTYQEQIDGHFAGFMHCCRGALSMMKAGGAIVAVASDAGKVATPSETVIGAMKAAIIMFARTLSLEVARDGIRVNVVTPSLVADTRSHDRIMANETGRKIFEKAIAKAKLGLPGPDDVAALIVFLSSPLAAKITGQAISVNGGISAA